MQDQNKDDKTKIITKQSIEDTVDYLDKNTILSINNKGIKNGIFLITEIPITEINKQGNKEQYSYEPKNRQKIEQLLPNDLIDYKKNPPKINESFKDKNIAICDKNGKLKFYGKVEVIDHEVADTTFKYLGPGEQGCMYDKNGKLKYKGYFQNSNKTYGIDYNEGYDDTKDINDKINKQQAIFYDHLGDKEFEHHGNKDLIISCSSPYIDNDIKKHYRNSYDNVIILNNKRINKNEQDVMYEYHKEQQCGDIENIKIVINNSYKYDFKDKFNNFLDEKGNKIKYDPEYINKMKADYWVLYDKIDSILKNNKKVKNIEIEGLSNFGLFLQQDNIQEINNQGMEVIKNKEKNDKIKINIDEKQNFIQQFVSFIRRDAYNKGIKLFFKFTTNNSISQVAENDNLNEEKDKKIISNNMVYYQYNPEDGSWIKFQNKNDYEDALEKSGYYNNTEIFSNDNTIQSHNVFCNIDDLQIQKQDINDDIEYKENILKEKQNDYQSICKDQNIIDKKTQIDQNNKNEHNNNEQKELSFAKISIIILSGIVFPIVGGIIAYSFFSKIENQEEQEIENKNTTINQYNDQQISINVPQGTKSINNDVNINLSNQQLENKI